MGERQKKVGAFGWIDGIDGEMKKEMVVVVVRLGVTNYELR